MLAYSKGRKARYAGNSASRNLQKYSNPNPLQKWLLHRFQCRVADLAQRSRDRLCSRITFAEDFHILDVGCGEGFGIEFLRGRMNGTIFYGADMSLDALQLAEGRNPGISLHQADAHFLPWRDRSFQLVVCLEVLEHVLEPERVLAELRRVSAGDILISVPHQPYFALANFLRGKNWRTLGEDPEHIHHWTRGQFLGWLEERLDVVEMVYSFPWILVLGTATR